MPSITTWNRLEPLAYGEDLQAGLQARVHDPLWMLARQWQFGELRGEDRGSPVEVHVQFASTPITRFRAGASGPDAQYDSRSTPLETLVEAESSPPVSLRQAARAGLNFLRRLRSNDRLSAYVGRALRKYGFDNETDLQSEPTLARFLETVQGRAPDGRRLHAAYRQAYLDDESLASADLEILIEESDQPAFRAVLAIWMKTHFSLFEEGRGGASSWNPRRMEYRFAVAGHTGQDEVVLEAEEYRGGHLDWHSFRRVAGSLSAQPPGIPGGPAVVEGERRLLPSPVDFPGMPMPRWWQFEDRRIDLGGVSAGGFDLARMLLIEFALSYGNDWYLVPLDLEVGSWSRTSLMVRDTFGEEFNVSPVSAKEGESQWQMFVVSGARAGDGFFLPPVLARSLSGKPLEEVEVARDQMANYAWAIEKVVENEVGRPVNRAEEGPRQALPPPVDETALKYRLGSTVPPYWFPLIAVAESPASRSIRLRLGRIGYDPQGGATEPRGRILKELASSSPPSLFEEEAPQAGAVITRVPQLARWIDGSTHVWTGRDKRPGRGQGSSGLRFDIVE